MTSSAVGRTLAERILSRAVPTGAVRAGDVVRVAPDLVVINDGSGALTFRQWERMGATAVARPERVVLVADHFAPAPTLAAARGLSVLREFATRHGIEHFFEMGKGGIEHSLLPERGMVRPGSIVVGGDSHTCTLGAVGAFGVGVGATDAAAILALGDVWLRVPETARWDLEGALPAYVTGKDVILAVLGEIGVSGAIYQAVEFGGEGRRSLTTDDRMAMCNMVAETGAKTALVVPDETTAAWADEHGVAAEPDVVPDDTASYASRRRIVLDALEPLVALPPSPGNVAPVADAGRRKVDYVYVGNCANGTLGDLRQAAAMLRGRKVAEGTRCIVVPATQQVYRQAAAEGLLETFAAAGAAVSTPGCGACFGGHMGLADDGDFVVANVNRNYRGRMGHPGAEVLLANSYVAAAAAVAGELVHPREVAEPVARTSP